MLNGHDLFPMPRSCVLDDTARLTCLFDADMTDRDDASARRERARELALLFESLKDDVRSLERGQESIRERQEESDRRITNEIHQVDLRLAVKVENLTVRAGIWGAIGGAVAIALPLGVALLLWIVRGH